MRRSLTLYFKSAVCSAWFRMRGFKSSIVACDGWLPKLYCNGSVQIGRRLMVHGHIARCEIGAATADARLELGDRVLINHGASVVATCHIEIGSDSLIGSFAAILDSDYHSIEPDRPTYSAPVIIGSNVWLGHGVVVLPGSNIGDHTVVGAGSVVKGDLPPRVLAVGSPARVVRELDIPEGWRRS